MVLVSRRTSSVLLALLGLFLLGTVGVLSLVRAYFRVDDTAYILATELGTFPEIRANARPAALDIAPNANASAVDVPHERIPRIIHQTWKTETLPPHWAKTRAECAAMMPDYQYMLWSDKSSRELIAADYPWFLPVFDSYPYNIQRADAIRYFVLHKYGGVYMDLDIGCRRRLDSLLRFDAILPKTIPVGVSNDLMFATKGHPLTRQLIDNLARFNHNFLMPYATVMFSTGPMFVSAVYGMLTEGRTGVRPSTADQPSAGFEGVRILPKSLYGKNAKPGEAPDSFFEHMYGSSWHEGDAGFLIFLRIYGRYLMLVGVAVVAYGLRRYYLGALYSLLHHAMHAARPLWAYVPQSVREWVPQEPAQGPEWVRLTGQDELEDEAPPVPVPLFHSEPRLGTAPSAPPRVTTPIPRPPSTAGYTAEKEVAMADHSRRAALEDTALGSYSTRQEPTRLPAYYVDNASAYAMDDAPLSPELRGRDDGELTSRRSFSLSRLRPSWRTLSQSSLRALVPPPLRSSASRAECGGETLDNVSVDEPLTRTISSQSDEYRREFASLVSRSNGAPGESPPLNATSPPPTLLVSPDLNAGHYHSAVTRRQAVGDVTRAMTPAVQPLPTPAHTPGLGRVRE
ncbi:uncharacterized protein MJAP1_002982 [Malassezia japonica]|uniref:Mannosyl phosphorylinositol ceramide synthase SUR1 n=1 Tax=Malassezia japonica TaxID=223818 RepID=A0AAF0EZQ6_9BASI|nr:uncharacterized protein MJAP1_002982 [Malassezia japonica]WFD40000.1 hypothetical protein MJAP1_002982 [Malassezia japonica]